MDVEFIKAVAGLLTSAGFGGTFAILVKRQSDRDASRLAEARFKMELDEKDEKDMERRRAEDYQRIAAIKEDLRDVREQLREKGDRLRDSEQLFQERVVACRDCQYPCVRQLQINAARRAIENSGLPDTEAGQEPIPPGKRKDA